MKLKFYSTLQCVRYDEHHSTDKLYYESDYSVLSFDYESDKSTPYSCNCRDFKSFKDLLTVNDSIFFNTLVRVFNIPNEIASCDHKDFLTLSEFYNLLFDNISNIEFSSETSFTERVDLMYDHKSYGYLEFCVFAKR